MMYLFIYLFTLLFFSLFRFFVGISIAILFVWSLINMMHIEIIGIINNTGAIVQIITIISLIIIIIVMTPSYNTINYIFYDFENTTGWSEDYYVILLSILLPIFGLAGYDGPAHLAEETKSSRLSAPMGIIYTVLFSGILGLLLIIALMLTMQDINDAINGISGNAAVQIITQTAGQNVAFIFSWLIVVNIFFGGVSSITVTSRILFALCRDKATVFSDVLSKLNPTFKSPINAIIFLFICQCSLLLIPLNTSGGVQAFYSILSIYVVGLQISYLIPIALKVNTFIFHKNYIKISKKLKLSGMSLGMFSCPVGIISSIWLFITTIILLLPTTYPVNTASMNYACVAVGFVILFGILNWELNSKHTFQGPPRLDDDVIVFNFFLIQSHFLFTISFFSLDYTVIGQLLLMICPQFKIILDYL